MTEEHDMPEDSTQPDVSPNERAAACLGAIQEVLRAHRCRLAIRMKTKPVGDPNYPDEVLVSSEPHVIAI